MAVDSALPSGGLRSVLHRRLPCSALAGSHDLVQIFTHANAPPSRLVRCARLPCDRVLFPTVLSPRNPTLPSSNTALALCSGWRKVSRSYTHTHIHPSFSFLFLRAENPPLLLRPVSPHSSTAAESTDPMLRLSSCHPLLSAPLLLCTRHLLGRCTLFGFFAV